MAGTSGDDPMVGQTIAEKYVLRGRIGSGGMGVVYEAEHTVTHRRVAVKLMSGAEQQWTPTAVQRFLREARVAAMIGHPNIIEVLDAGSLANGLPYIVLTLLQGESLAAQLQRVGVLPPRDAVEVAIEVLEALNAAHARNVVHRDIKPENVFVSTTANGRRAITLLDFGISKVTAEGGAESKTLTKTGSVLGTADYMSPEQVRGDDEIDGRADLWAVGVMLYRMVCGQLPFAGKNYNLVVVSVLTEKAAPLAEIAPKLPRVLEAAIARAMEKERTARFANAAEMLSTLREMLAGPDAHDASWTEPAVEASAVTGRVSTDSAADLGQAATVVTNGGSPAVVVPAKVDTLAAQEAPTRDRIARSSTTRRNAVIGAIAAVAAGAVVALSWRSKQREPNATNVANVTAARASTTAPVVAPRTEASRAVAPSHVPNESATPNVAAPAVAANANADSDAGALPAPSANAVNTSTSANAGAPHAARARSGSHPQAGGTATTTTGSATATPAANGSNNGQGASRPRTGFDEI